MSLSSKSSVQEARVVVPPGKGVVRVNSGRVNCVRVLTATLSVLGDG